jgi:hypothetical protein
MTAIARHIERSSAAPAVRIANAAPVLILLARPR